MPSLGLSLGLDFPKGRFKRDPLAGIPFALRLQTHNGNGIPLGLYKDTACTIPATTAGESVAAWRDELSGGGLTATQGNPINQPVLSFVNGEPTLHFDGVNDFMEVAFAPALPLVVQMALRPYPGGGYNYVFDGLAGDDVNNWVFRYNPGGEASMTTYVGGASIVGPVLTSGDRYVITADYEPSAVLRLNGAQVGTGSFTILPAMTGLRIGGNGRFVPDSFAEMRIAHFIISAESSNIEAVEAYLSNATS